MCTVSAQLKLCTCSGKEIDWDKPHWILYRKHSPTTWSIGEIVHQFMEDPELTIRNTERLKIRLNEADVFDFQADPESGDRLYLFFQRGGINRPEVSYVFEYDEPIWVESHFGPFEAENEFKELRSGFIRDAIESGE
ncbi:MAG TPA: hypothetical protein PK509_17540 [Catalimonadaceae bacterium]|nr:hypothetical protein [Catalimonadaceae bacterium]